MNRAIWLISTYFLTTTLAYANCVPPMETLFACDLEEVDARVEFCHEILEPATSNGSSTTGDQNTYSFARGFEKAELYFEPSSTLFNYFEANSVDRKIYGEAVTGFLSVGYQNGDYVYAALLAVDEDYYDEMYGAEVRVYKNRSRFTRPDLGGETSRLFCRPETVIANQSEFRP